METSCEAPFPALLASALVFAAPVALAHNAFVECEAVDDGRIRCTGGLSDGSAAPGVTLDVIGYDERVLVNGQLGDDSRFTFPARTASSTSSSTSAPATPPSWTTSRSRGSENRAPLVGASSAHEAFRWQLPVTMRPGQKRKRSAASPPYAPGIAEQP